MKFIFTFCVLFSFCAGAQESLQIRMFRFNHLKKISVEPGNNLELKLKGERHYRKIELTGLRDSAIFYGENSQIKLSQIKVIRIHRSRLFKTFATAFAYAGFGFIILDTSNNFILHRDGPAINPKALNVSAWLLGSAIALELLSVKRVRINNRNSLKIMDEDYFRFN